MRACAGGSSVPIKPENKARYPANWAEIRQAAGERAQWTCQHPGCTARHYAVGKWLLPTIGTPLFFDLYEPAPSYRDARALAAEQWHHQGEEGYKPLVIVLTCAHLDHQPENCDPSNLRMFCQRHHLAHDRQHHQANAQATRRARAGTGELFA
jgi:hypothetical protein